MSLTPSFIVAAILLWGIASLRLFYRVGTGEHDAFMMAAGVAYGWHSGSIINPLCYGSDLQFLFYYILHPMVQLGLHDARSVLLSMNVMGTLCSLAIPILLVLLLFRLSGEGNRSRLAGLLFMTSPVYLMLTSYGHPFHLALTISLCAWLVFLPAARSASARRSALGLSLAMVLQAIALMIRFEQVTLFGVMGLVLYAVGPKPSRRDWVAAIAFLAVPTLLFFVFRPVLTGSPLVDPSGLKRWLGSSLLLRGFDPGRVRWSAAHFIVEAGGALLLLALWCGVRCVSERRWRLLGCAAGAIVPTLAVYAGNPSPPRHFCVAAMGLAYLVAFGVGDKDRRLSGGLVVGALVGNLLAPWVLTPLGDRADGRRAILTYNIVERSDRNRAQIRAAHELYARLIATAARRPVAVFGNWIQISLICSELASDPDVTVERPPLPEGPKPFVLRSPRFTFYLVEAYDSSAVGRASAELRREAPGLACVSLVESAPELNDLHIRVPPEIHLWSS